MTLPATSQPFTDKLPPEDVQVAANQLLNLLAQQKQGDAVLKAYPSDTQESFVIDLHPDISDVLMQVLRIVGSGKAATIVPINQQLTTQQAADILNVSRPYFIKLLQEKSIPFTKVGRHRRIEAEDVFRYKDEMMNRRDKALSDLAEMDADLL
jgi:excisionase family DNA binding protein